MDDVPVSYRIQHRYLPDTYRESILYKRGVPSSLLIPSSPKPTNGPLNPVTNVKGNPETTHHIRWH